MYYAGISSNIMSLAGIAIAIGVLVDAGIVVTENAFRFIEQRGVDTTRSPPSVGDRPRVHATGRAPRVLLDGDHPARLHSGVRADRPGRQAVSPARLHQDVCRARGDDHRRHARSRALHLAARREAPPGRGEPRHARASRRLSAGAAERARASDRHDRDRCGALHRRAGRGARDRERVHAAAQRGRPDVHAHRRSQHLARREHQESRRVRTRR